MRRGRGGYPSPSSSAGRVPTTSEVRPGASVNIVLKADQPTGRTVSGVVRDVLTRGDHHRGIKVRLADGRIGRVQSIAASTSTELAEGITDVPVPEDGGDAVSVGGPSFEGRRGRGGRWKQTRDVRLDDDQEAPPEQIGLDAYITHAKPRGKAAKKAAAAPTENGEPVQAPATETVAVTCPVCGAFEGDEAAVAHHVASHFD